MKTVRLVGTHFSDLSKLMLLILLKNVENFNIRGYNNIFNEKFLILLNLVPTNKGVLKVLQLLPII